MVDELYEAAGWYQTAVTDDMGVNRHKGKKLITCCFGKDENHRTGNPQVRFTLGAGAEFTRRDRIARNPRSAIVCAEAVCPRTSVSVPPRN